MKIFQVVPYYPPHIGGMEFYVQRLSEQLTALGHEVKVFTSSNEAYQSTYKLNNVPIYAFKTMTKIYNVPIVPSLFMKLIEEEKPDVIHTHQYPVFLSDISALVAQIRKIPLVVHVHVVSDRKSLLSGLISKTYYSTLGLRTLKAADAVVVPSLAYKTKMVEMRVNATKVRVVKVIPYGIESEKFRSQTNTESFKAKYNCSNSIIILSVGRLNYQKGFQFLIKAMPDVLQKVPNAKLIIVGEGEDRSFLIKLAESLKISGSVIFTGGLPQAELPNAYSAASLFVLPSLFESFGISLIEAQASGKPVIGTKSGGAPEALIEGKTGLLVNPGNPKALSEAILRILTDNALAFEMGIKGKAFVESQFDIKAIVGKVVELYQQTIEAKNST
jgi:glycosyltransferase involved in cell wall biosynthesis